MTITNSMAVRERKVLFASQFLKGFGNYCTMTANI